MKRPFFYATTAIACTIATAGLADGADFSLGQQLNFAEFLARLAEFLVPGTS